MSRLIMVRDFLHPPTFDSNHHLLKPHHHVLVNRTALSRSRQVLSKIFNYYESNFTRHYEQGDFFSTKTLLPQNMFSLRCVQNWIPLVQIAQVFKVCGGPRRVQPSKRKIHFNGLLTKRQGLIELERKICPDLNTIRGGIPLNVLLLHK